MKTKKSSIEREVENYYLNLLKQNEVAVVDKNGSINDEINTALQNAPSKQGGKGGNHPDIQFFIEVGVRRLPVMVEAKGEEGKLLKKTENGEIELETEYKRDTKTHKKGDPCYDSINNFAVNGAVHYAKSVIMGTTQPWGCLAVGVNGFKDETGAEHYESEIYYLPPKERFNAPIYIGKQIDLLYQRNWAQLFELVKDAQLTPEQKENLRRKVENDLEEEIKAIHQEIYDANIPLGTDEKLYLFCGLIMATWSIQKSTISEEDLKGNNAAHNNDGVVILNQIKAFLEEKGCSDEKRKMIETLLGPVFQNDSLWKTGNKGESTLRNLFMQVKKRIVPCLEGNLRLDFMGKIFNSLSEWTTIEKDKKNDVVLTPRYVTTLMAKMAQTNMDSVVWDNALGSAGFLVAAMEIMLDDANKKITDQKKRDEKIRHIKERQLLGIEKLDGIFILAVLNMILMGDGSSNLYKGNSITDKELSLSVLSQNIEDGFPANVFLLNPPYSAEGNGLIFVETALKQMTRGYACVLIQSSAGNGKGKPYSKRILSNNTLKASIRMPADLFQGAYVHIFCFKIGRPHELDDEVVFIDFREDGYKRMNRSKSSQNVNLRDDGTAEERYDEVLAHVLGKKAQTNHYTEENGLLIKDTISLDGDDWLVVQHQKIKETPTEVDYMRAVADYYAWEMTACLREGL